MSTTTTIRADQVELMLFARRVAKRQSEPCRWAVMGAHIATVNSCRRRQRLDERPLLARPSMLTPMNRGMLDRCIERMRLTQGLPAIRRTFGCGLRAILAETKSGVMR
jgi:hypothetical protein